jgi:hypothetical protein
MVKVLKYLLNAPYTLLGLCNVIFCVPYKLDFAKDALVFHCLTCGFVQFGFPKVRGFAIGNVAIIRKGQRENIVEHELVHVEQYMRYPFIFGFMYLYELRNGYWNNKFEIEAYDRTDSYPAKRP